MLGPTAPSSVTYVFKLVKPQIGQQLSLLNSYLFAGTQTFIGNGLSQHYRAAIQKVRECR
jgi:hypothetical protein